LTYKIAHEIHPNNETRLTLFKVRGVFSSLKDRAAVVLGVSTAEVVELARSVPPPSPNLTFVPNSEPANQSVLVNSHKRTAFGLDAKRRIFRASGALDRFDEVRENYLFLTATLPGDTDEAKWAIAEYAHEIIDGLKSWLSKRLLDRKEFYVWENQKRGALHFHYCIYCPDKEIQAEITREFKRQMVRLYDGISQKHGCNLWGKHEPLGFDGKAEILQARVEVVYKSVAAYMAGYLAGKGDKHSSDHLHRYYPKRWFGVSRPLSTLINQYTEKREYEFTSLKEAYEFFHETREEILDDALTSSDYAHKIGEGKTHVSYHTLEKQLELWQPKEMLIHSPQKHPNIASFISLTLRTSQLLREALINSKSLPHCLPLKYVLYFQDATLQTSMRNGALSRKTVLNLEGVFSAYDFSSNSEYKIRQLFNSLRLYTLMVAKFHPQMRFSPQGFLQNNADFNESVDEMLKTCYVRTNTETVDTPNEVDGSRAHVASELASPYSQPELW